MTKIWPDCRRPSGYNYAEWHVFSPAYVPVVLDRSLPAGGSPVAERLAALLEDRDEVGYILNFRIALAALLGVS